MPAPSFHPPPLNLRFQGRVTKPIGLPPPSETAAGQVVHASGTHAFEQAKQACLTCVKEDTRVMADIYRYGPFDFQAGQTTG